MKKREDLRFIPIIDAGIAIGNNKAHDEGIKRNVFIRSGYYLGELLIGKVWPGFTYFVDYFHPNAT